MGYVKTMFSHESRGKSPTITISPLHCDPSPYTNGPLKMVGSFGLPFEHRPKACFSSILRTPQTGGEKREGAREALGERTGKRGKETSRKSAGEEMERGHSERVEQREERVKKSKSGEQRRVPSVQSQKLSSSSEGRIFG